MAGRRRGVFGRLPRAAPDLTNSIVALVREAQAQVDQNMVSAWKGGGKVDGKGVDDDRLLKHLKDRRDQISPDDPAWDDWNNNYIQYDFAINESKMALKNDQGKISDAQMAAFYRKWAGREDVQKDSEFYRSLLSRAAKWNASAKARSAGRSQQSAYDNHARWADGYYKDHVKSSEVASSYLLEIAKVYEAAPPNANSLDDIYTNSDAYGKFLDVVSDGKADNPTVQGYIDLMTAEIRKTSPNFTWSEGNITDLMDRGEAGLKRLVGESMNKTEREAWRKHRETLRYEKTRVRQAAANNRIQIAADTFADDLDECDGDPYCARRVTQKLRDKLGAEVANVIASPGGGIGAMTQDVEGTAGALSGTIGQLDRILAGKPVEETSAATLAKGGGPNGPNEGYTVFDAAAGLGKGAGALATLGNLMNDDMAKLDAGGWVMTEPRSENGVALVDGQGQPVYQHKVFGANEAVPAGMVAVPGVAMMVDSTRTEPNPYGIVYSVTRTPTTYVMPAPARVSYTDAAGNTIPASQAADVKAADGKTPAVPPWVELSFRGPDGRTRTVYRTGNGSDEPYLFHEQPPVGVDAKKDAAGRFIVPTTIATDEKGVAFTHADYTPFVAGVTAARQQVKSGNFVLGTYSSPGAAATQAAIGEAWKANTSTADRLASEYLRQFRVSIDALPMEDPHRALAERDYGQLSQTANLYKQGGDLKTLGSAYGETNNRDPRAARMYDELNRAGFGRFGEAEMDRRVELLSGIEDAETRLAARRASGIPTPMGGVRGLGLYGQNAALSGIAKEQEALAGQRKDVFNPTISVSNIKVPGMNPLMQQGPPATGFMGLPGRAYTQTPFAPPSPPVLTQGPNGPSYKAPAGGFTPPTFAPPPSPKTQTTPGEKKKDDYVPPKPPKVKPYEPPPPASKTTQHIL